MASKSVLPKESGSSVGTRQLAALVKSLRQESNVPIFRQRRRYTITLEKAMDGGECGV